MTIIAVYKNQNVEVLDLYQAGGVDLANVKALDGAPFVGGNKWAVKTPYTIARANELELVDDCNCVLPEQSCPICRQGAAKVYENF